MKAVRRWEAWAVCGEGRGRRVAVIFHQELEEGELRGGIGLMRHLKYDGSETEELQEECFASSFIQ